MRNFFKSNFLKKKSIDATKEEVDYVEVSIYKNCSKYLDKIENTTDEEFKNILNNAMMFDIERGLIPGQIKHKIYHHNDWFIDFENKLWNQINIRIESLGDDFFKID